MLLHLQFVAGVFTVNKRETRKDHVKGDNSPQQIQTWITDLIINLLCIFHLIIPRQVQNQCSNVHTANTKIDR